MAARRRVKRYAGRKDSSVEQHLARVPKDVVDRLRGHKFTVVLPAAGTDEETQVTCTLGTFAKFSLRTRDADTAAIRRARIKQELLLLWDATRRGPVRLTKRQIDALAGEVYRHLIREWGDDPGTPERWEAWKAFTRACWEGRIDGAESIRPDMSEEQAAARAIFGDDLTAGINALSRTCETEALEQRCGRLTHFILDQHHIVLDPEQRLPLLQEIARAALQAGWQLKRHAQGNWRSDPDAGRFPTFEEPRKAAVTFTQVYDRWCETDHPKPSSRKNRVSLLKSFARSLGHNDMARVSEEDVIRWRAAMLADGRAPSTVKTALDNAKAHFGYARAARLIPTNPFSELRLTIKADRLPTQTAPMVGYSSDEVARLLALAATEIRGPRRWLPLLAAATGARVSELAQLSGARVVEIEGVPAVRIRPAEDGGTLKNKHASRDVPLHPAVIEAGFLDFVRARGDGPLFYDKRRGGREPDRKHVSTWVGSTLGAWIRSAGFVDKTKAPNHAFRHFWKTAAHRAGVDAVTADFIQGHRTPGEATRYRHLEEDFLGLYRAVCAIPLPRITRDDAVQPANRGTPRPAALGSGAASRR